MIGLLVERYMFSRENRHRGRTVRIMLGLILSTLVMMTVLSVMDFLQEGRLSLVCSIQSFPVVVETDDPDEARALAEEYSSSATTFIYREDEVLLESGRSQGGYLVRYIDSSYSGGLYATTENLTRGLLLPYRYFGSQLPRTATITFLEEGSAVRLVPASRTFLVEGYYQTRLGDFDQSHIFLPLSAAPEGLPYLVAFTDLRVDENTLIAELEGKGYTVRPWYESESMLYSALKLEKLIMTILLSSLYLIVFVQIVQSATMLSRVKARECAALYLMGLGRGRIAFIFSLLGLCLSFISLALGLILSRLLLSALPLLGIFSGSHFSIDWQSFLIIALLMLLLSALSYGLSFMKNLKTKTVREVLNAV